MGKLLYVAVGSVSNIGEAGMKVEEGRAMIWEYDLAAGRARQFGAGLRNPNGLDFSPWTGELWTTVNERDMLGSDLVPDYLTNVPIGAQYGWPWVYYRTNIDRRVEAPMPRFLMEYVRKPEYRARPARGGAGAGVLQGGRPHGGQLRQRGLHRAARLVEPQAACRAMTWCSWSSTRSAIRWASRCRC